MTTETEKRVEWCLDDLGHHRKMDPVNLRQRTITKYFHRGVGGKERVVKLIVFIGLHFHSMSTGQFFSSKFSGGMELRPESPLRNSETREPWLQLRCLELVKRSINIS